MQLRLFLQTGQVDKVSSMQAAAGKAAPEGMVCMTAMDARMVLQHDMSMQQGVGEQAGHAGPYNSICFQPATLKMTGDALLQFTTTAMKCCTASVERQFCGTGRLQDQSAALPTD